MARQRSTKTFGTVGLMACVILACASTPSQAGISISIGARIATPHVIVEMGQNKASHREIQSIHPPYRPRPIFRRPRPSHYPAHWQYRWPTPIVKPVCPSPVKIPPQPTQRTVWITNSNGSQIAVKLTRRGGGYIGPRGEIYSAMPTHEQLRMVYGF